MKKLLISLGFAVTTIFTVQAQETTQDQQDQSQEQTQEQYPEDQTQEEYPPADPQEQHLREQQDGSVVEDTTAQSSASFDSQKFVKEAASGGMMEVKLGEMASQKASSEEVKAFGERMVEDHSKANNELKQIASANNMTIPETMMDKQQKIVDKLSKLSGEEFDEEYMKTMLKDHKKEISKFEKAAEKADNTELKSWAQKTLDVLEQHHQLAEETQQAVQASANE